MPMYDLARQHPHYVARDESEALIAALEKGAPDERAGIFGPASMLWRVNRESATFLAAGRASLLQLAHPWVASSIDQHSTIMNDPIARFHNTFRVVFAMMFGSVQQATGAARHLYELHARVQGSMTEDVAGWERGSHYRANEAAALRWVYATLIESAVLAYEFVLPPLSQTEREAYYAESKILAGLFGVPAGTLPSDWSAFLHYCREMEESDALGVGASGRAMGQNVLAGAGSWIHPPRWYRALTAAWLPERLRGAFGLVLTREDECTIQSARRWLRRVYPRTPKAVRFVGPWHEALARLRNRKPGLIARAGNRFWMGQARIPFAS
jgi:uncharacterized protein (DUF2236 family)